MPRTESRRLSTIHKLAAVSAHCLTTRLIFACVSELHVNRQRIIQGAILSCPDTAFASQEASTDTPGMGLSPSQRRGGVEATRTNEPKAKSAILHSAIGVLARAVPNGHGHTADGLWSVSYILHNWRLIFPPITPTLQRCHHMATTFFS